MRALLVRALVWVADRVLLTVVGAEDLALLADAGAWFGHGCGEVRVCWCWVLQLVCSFESCVGCFNATGL